MDFFATERAILSAADGHDVAPECERLLHLCNVSSVRHPWLLFVLMHNQLYDLAASYQHCLDFGTHCPSQCAFTGYEGATCLTAAAEMGHARFVKLGVEKRCRCWTAKP